MPQKVIIDTNVYIDLFNKGMHKEIVNPFQHITYLAYPVMHALWMGVTERKELVHWTMNHSTRFNTR